MSVGATNSTIPSFKIDDILNTGGSSIHMKFAALQMKMAELNKEKANGYMDQITSAQEEGKKVADMIAKARALQTSAGTGSSTMTNEMKTFFTARGLSWDTSGSNDSHNKTEWDFNIKSLANYQDQVGSNTSQLMVYVQDFMSQYSSSLTGANSTISAGGQLASSLAKG